MNQNLKGSIPHLSLSLERIDSRCWFSERKILFTSVRLEFHENEKRNVKKNADDSLRIYELFRMSNKVN